MARPRKEDKEQFSTKISPDILARMRQHAEANGQNFNFIIEKAFTEFLEKYAPEIKSEK